MAAAVTFVGENTTPAVASQGGTGAWGENTAPGGASQGGTGVMGTSTTKAAELLRDGLMHGHGPVRIYVTLDNKRYLANVHGKEKEICMRSLFIFDALGPVRQHIYWLVEWKWFENFVLFLIFFSSINLAIYRYRVPDSSVNDFIAVCDPCLTVAFTLECILKVIAYGLILDKGSYLRSGWNWLDFIVVISGWLDELPSDSANLRFLLVFKVLRPLRSLTVMPQMRLLVNTVLQSMKRLTQFCLMVVFLFSVFSIVGLNFWAGVMYRQCRTDENPKWNEVGKCWSWPPAEESSGRLCGGRYSCEEGHRCGSIYLDDPLEDMRPKFDGPYEKPGRKPGMGAPWCPDTDDTWNAEDFNFHLTHFDHMPGALVVVFQCMTLEGWVDLMYMLQDADSDVVASIYFVILITATAFFLLNAALAIVTETFDDSFRGEDRDELDVLNDEALMTPSEMTPMTPMFPATPADDNTWASSRNVEDRKAMEQKKKQVAPDTGLSQELSEVTVLKGGDLDASGDEMAKPEDDEDDFLDDVDWDDAPWWDVKVVRMFRAVASSEWFMNIVMVFILFNVVTMCLDKYPPPPSGMQSFLQVCNYIFAVAFTVEMIILLVAMGPKSYLLTVMTAFDGAIVVAGWVEICMSGGGGAVRAFRGLRLLRIFKLAKKLVSLRVMLKAMWNTLASLGNLAVLLGLMIFIFTLMGRELFALKFHFDDDGKFMDDKDSPYCGGEKDNFDCVPRAHFDTFIWAFTTVFQILTGENWNAIMYDGMKKNILFIVYFILVMVFGQFIMLSLFVAVLMTKFEDARITQQANEDEMRNQKTKKSEASTPSLTSFASSLRESMTRSFTGTPSGPKEEEKRLPEAVDLGDGVSVIPVGSDDSSKPQPAKPPRWIWYQHYAFFVLSPDNPVRVACRLLVENKRFDQAVLVCICISSLAMALDQPMADPEAVLTQILYWMGFVFTVVFTIEMLLKMIAFGCLYGNTNGKRAYWLQPWNILDGIVVTVSILDIATQGKGALGAMKTLRIIRALRPLRVVARFQNLRLVVQTLFKSVPALLNVAVVGVLVFLIFALVFCNYLKGTFYSCMSPDGGELEGFSFDANVTYVRSVNGLKSAFNANGDFSDLSSTEMANLVMEQTTPLCLDVTTGILTPLGRLTGTNRWQLDAVSCSSGQVQTTRATKDSPICIGSCNARIDKATARCPAPPTEVSELPSNCPGAELTSYYRSLTNRDLMFCGPTPSAPNALSCSQAFCPDGCPDPADGGCDDRKKSCKEDCKEHQIYCTDSCAEGKEGTQDCTLCRAQCEAACQCQEYCESFIKDAGNCVEQGGRWLQTLSQDFDNIFSSFLTLVEISTTEGWIDVLYQACDAVDPYMEPIRDHQELWAIAFMFFIFVSFFFYINLCVGVIVDNYNAIKEENGASLLTKEQMDWIATHRSLHKRTVFYGLTNLHKAPFLQVSVYRFIVHPFFENFIMFCIVGNTLSMGLKIFPEPSREYEDAREIINWIFGGVFFVEMVLKLFALRLNYFKENWNIFDFICVMSTLAGLIISMASDLQMATAMSAIRAFRIARLFRLVRFLKGLNRMFTALLLSLPKLINVGAILLLFFFLFSVLGVQLFAKTKFVGPHGIHANFRDPGRAFLTLIRSVTGEGWNEMMHALSRDLTYYTKNLAEICINEDLLSVDKSTYPILKEKCLVDTPIACGKDFSYIYFLIFTAVMTMVMVNLMIAVILEAFTDSASSDLMEVIDVCVRKWPKYDTNLCLKLPIGKIFLFIQDVAATQGVEFDSFDHGTPATPAEAATPPSTKSKDTGRIFETKVEEELFLEELSMSKVPMKIAKLCQVKVMKDGQVHFLYAVRMAVAVTLAHNSFALMSDFENAESSDERLKNLRHNQVRRCMNQSEIKESVSFQEQVGAAKIQAMFRTMKAWKEAKSKERQRNDDIREEEVKDEAPAEPCGEAPPAHLPSQLTPREAG
mmetsp:Transcript_57180/g.100037  ORF Transcript_57180/g.100037 Transcript_57180/m.100037 type:complete len:1956 (+) Transcript_57180:179-6046(+)